MKITIVLAQKIIGIFFSFFFGGDQLVFFYIYIYIYILVAQTNWYLGDLNN